MSLILDPSEDPAAHDLAREGVSHGWIGRLDWPSLQRLRDVTKRILMKHYDPAFVTDREADKIIDAMGPYTMTKWEKAAIDRGLARQRFLHDLKS